MKITHFLFVVIFFILINNTLAETGGMVFSMNNKTLTEPNSDNYRFIAAGHIYGNPDSESIQPAETLIKNIPKLQLLNPNMIILLGDTVRQSDKDNFKALENTLLGRISVPVYNAVGNHDVGNRFLYESRYNRTFFNFKYRNSQMIILDTELSDQNISGDQLTMFLDALEAAEKDHEIQHVFIFMHKPLFFIGEERYSKIAPHVNAWRSYATETNFKEILHKHMLALSREKNVFLIAGDIGVQGSFPLFYDKKVDANLYYLATGLGDTEDDAVLLIEVDGGDFSITPISLTGEKLDDIETYNTTHWKNYFNERSLRTEKHPLQISKSVRFIFGLLAVILIYILLLKFKKQR